MSPRTNTLMDRESRDLLIEMRTQMVAIRADIKELKDGTTTTLNDHETRLRFIERYMWLAIGVVGLLEFALNVWSNLH